MDRRSGLSQRSGFPDICHCSVAITQEASMPAHLSREEVRTASGHVPLQRLAAVADVVARGAPEGPRARHPLLPGHVVCLGQDSSEVGPGSEGGEDCGQMRTPTASPVHHSSRGTLFRCASFIHPVTAAGFNAGRPATQRTMSSPACTRVTSPGGSLSGRLAANQSACRCALLRLMSCHGGRPSAPACVRR